jgi:hypothetical protein
VSKIKWGYGYGVFSSVERLDAAAFYYAGAKDAAGVWQDGG